MTPRSQRRPRRVHVKSTDSYTLWRLPEGGISHVGERQLSPGALWLLLAYLPKAVRSQPWVRQLVTLQLARIHDRPPYERDLISQFGPAMRAGAFGP
jgi:hypothetical protein